jgi:hypothetical protein
LRQTGEGDGALETELPKRLVCEVPFKGLIVDEPDIGVVAKGITKVWIAWLLVAMAGNDSISEVSRGNSVTVTVAMTPS